MNNSLQCKLQCAQQCITWWQLLPSNIRSTHCSADKCPALTNLLVIIVGGIPIAMPTVLSVTLALGAFRLAKEGAIVARMSAVEEMAGEQLIHPGPDMIGWTVLLREGCLSPACCIPRSVLVCPSAATATVHCNTAELHCSSCKISL